MAVNGVEIRLGQKWRTRGGAVVEIVGRDDRRTYLWQGRSVRIDGVERAGYEPTGFDLIELLEDSPATAGDEREATVQDHRKHSHYFKDVSKLQHIDVYRVLSLFNVTDQAIGHALKKLLVAGGRGVKDIDKDVQEAIDTLTRWQEMRAEVNQ